MRAILALLFVPGVALALDWGTDLDQALEKAKKDGKPVLVLVTQDGDQEGGKVAATLGADSLKKKLDDLILVRVDASKDKAKAARFEPRAPLVLISPRGVIVDRVEKPVPEDDMTKRLDVLAAKGKEADEALAKLEAAKKDCAGLDALAGFWLDHKNWFEAVPVLEALVKLAGEEEFSPDKRLDRWLDLARAQAVLLRYDDAVATAETLVKHAGTRKKIEPMQKGYFLMGTCREKQGNKDEAIKAYDRCYQVSPDTILGKSAAAARNRLKQP